jgi:hypothetical protein
MAGTGCSEEELMREGLARLLAEYEREGWVKFGEHAPESVAMMEGKRDTCSPWKALGEDLGGILFHFLARLRERPAVTMAALLEVLTVCMERLGREGEWSAPAEKVAGRLRLLLSMEQSAVNEPPRREGLRSFAEWNVLKALCSPAELQLADRCEALTRPPEEWQRLKRKCTPGEWDAVLRGGEDPPRLRRMPLYLQWLADGWEWLSLAPARVRRRLAAEYAPALSKPVQRLLCASAPSLRRWTAEGEGRGS